MCIRDSDKLPFDKYLSTINATMMSGATDTKAEADKDHHGVIEEFNATILTGNNCTSVKVKMKAKKKSIQPNIIQNIPATISPGIELGSTTLKKAWYGLQPSIKAVSSISLGTLLKKSTIIQTAMGISKTMYTTIKPIKLSSKFIAPRNKKKGIDKTIGGMIL